MGRVEREDHRAWVRRVDTFDASVACGVPTPKARVDDPPALYEVTVVLRDEATLAPQRERTPYQEPEPLAAEAAWYAGDFHVHSIESGDARPDLDEVAAFAALEVIGSSLDFDVTSVSLVSRLEAPKTLAEAEAEAASVTVDQVPPPPATRIGPVAETQLAFAHWDVAMPFEATLSKVRNAITAEVTAVSDTADLAISGDWIAEGVVLYSFNGERLTENLSISGHFLQNLTVDPDGYSRATVRYRDPATGIIDRGLLSVPVVRQMGLADGTTIEARMSDQVWVLQVTSVGAADNGLQPGDILVSETLSETSFSTPEVFVDALDALAASKAKTAELTVIRDGSRQDITWHLARETAANN